MENEPIIKSITIDGVEIPMSTAPSVDESITSVLDIIELLERDEATDYILSTTSSHMK